MATGLPRSDGSLVAWGNADCGGRIDRLKDVEQVQASAAAFAAILGDKSVAR